MTLDEQRSWALAHNGQRVLIHPGQHRGQFHYWFGQVISCQHNREDRGVTAVVLVDYSQNKKVIHLFADWQIELEKKDAEV